MFNRTTRKWLSIGIGVKRWLLLLVAGVLLTSIGIAEILSHTRLEENPSLYNWLLSACIVAIGAGLSAYALRRFSRNLLAPYRRHYRGRVIDVVYAHSKRHKGLKVVVIGGGTGLPSVLRGMKAHTSNITAVVTVADDGGSSGRLRRELGVLPPGDLRNNIAALADDESLMTKLFQHRFDEGDLNGHSFGNLFIAALASVSGGVENALPEIERVLNIQGRVLPATLDDVDLVATVLTTNQKRKLKVRGESKISEIGGHIEVIAIEPLDARAFSQSVDAINEADLIVIGPGSLYTSILPNLLVSGIAQAIRKSTAHRVYICNVATQPGETSGYSVADHVLALERHIGRGVFDVVLANDATPPANPNTHYVPLTPPDHEIFRRYVVHYADLTDAEQPWRHDPQKLADSLQKIVDSIEVGSRVKSAEPL